MTTFPEGVWRAAAVPGSGPDGGNPPLYYAALDAWSALFGIGAAAVRSLSLLLGLAHVAAVAFLARSAGASRGAALGAMAVAALSPIHVFYSTEARAYALLLLLLTLSTAFFFRAVRTGRALDWAAHGAALLLAMYTHNLAVPFVAAFWAAAAVLRADRARALALAATHGTLAVCYAPWAPVLLAQTQGGAHEWIRAYWDEAKPVLLVFRSFESMFVGGRLPEYLSMPAVSSAVRAGGIALLALAALALARPEPSSPKKAQGAPPPRSLLALGVFLSVPLLFLLAYSFAKAPLYLVGRYDLPAEPAFAVLAGIGLERLARRLGRRGGLAVGAAILLLSFASLRELVLHPRIAPAPGAKAARGELLASAARDGDVVVCTGFTTAETWYQLVLRGRSVEVATYPPALREHIGWYSPDRELARGEEALRGEARAVLARASRGAPHVWLVVHASPGRGAHAEIMNLFFDELQRAQMRIELPHGREEDAQRLGVGRIAR
jgi:4-amino-4-deoxy-L-arabinose transferase-like glycosyltransferase